MNGRIFLLAGALVAPSCGRSDIGTGTLGSACFPNQTCMQGLTCLNGICTCSQARHFSFRCDSGDVYWFDGCGKRQELKDDCQSQGCDGTACAADIVNMVLINDYPGGSFWIDQYEASTLAGVWGSGDLDPNRDGKCGDEVVAAAHRVSHGIEYDPADIPAAGAFTFGTKRARSVPGVLPDEGGIDFWHAARACANAGKRLCTQGEWQWVCQNGAAASLYPYGDSWDGQTVIGRDCWTADLGRPVQPTATASGCKTTAWSSPVWDLIGNVGEWTGFNDAFSADLQGGTAEGSSGASINCGWASTGYPYQATFGSGFRCCRDP